jgi:phenylpropionate dioxygenase-like ring-hydroxylating dioxygenase large terminal subunit
VAGLGVHERLRRRPPIAEHLGNIDAVVADYRPERLVLGAVHEYDVTANWKIIVENYNECYHCPSIHPELCEVTPPDSARQYPGSHHRPPPLPLLDDGQHVAGRIGEPRDQRALAAGRQRRPGTAPAAAGSPGTVSPFGVQTSIDSDRSTAA